jgi:alanine-glyoxylate transaminase/serine-glyoxylate transaminase/serine-pyruvate transaminase
MREFQFLQTPGPTNVPGRILRELSRPTIDHRGPDFPGLSERVISGLQSVFRTNQPVVIFPSSGTGAWEAALVNTLSPGDSVLMYETGYFATLWKDMAQRLGLNVNFLPGDWRTGVDASAINQTLIDDRDKKIKAVCCVHGETSTGVVSSVPDIRKAMDDADHPALLIVDAISSLAASDYRHDEWRADVTISSSQKGLMLPPGLSFNALSDNALRASKTASLSKSYWDWNTMLASNKSGYFPYTPATNLLYGLAEALAMIREEGLDETIARHARLAEATRRAVTDWGLEIYCNEPQQFSNSLTAVLIPRDYDADEFRSLVLENFNLALGGGLGKLAGKIFRIGHLGCFNELMLCGVLSGISMGLQITGVPLKRTGVDAALEYLGEHT